MEFSDSPPLTGVVIITLPPPDNPSKGKTITAFTLSNDDSSPTAIPNTNPEPLHQSLQIQSPRNRQLQLSWERFVLVNPRTFLSVMGFSLVALFVWVSVSPQNLFELRESNDDEKPQSFVLPLYHKLVIGERSQRDVELKLGRFVDFNLSEIVAPLDIVMGDSKIAASVSAFISPVRGNIYPDGLYYTFMIFGSPPKPYFLDMDTGSDLTWIQCDAPCTSCAKGAHPFYKPTKSNIIPPKDLLCLEVQRTQSTKYCETCHQCDYEIEYADHSSSMGVLARDSVHLMIANGSLVKSKVVFGCAYDQQGLLLSSLVKTDGILGLSRSKVSLSSQLASLGIINNVIGHCLATDANDGGYLFLGDEFVPYKQMAWIPMLNNPSMNFYRGEIVKLRYGNDQLRLDGVSNGLGRLLFDSGSSYTYFTKQAYSDLITSLKYLSVQGLIEEASDPTLPVCWRSNFPIRSIIDVKKFFKPLNLQVGSKWWVISKKLQILPEGFLIISSKGNVCLGILDGSEVHDGSTIILGDISLRGQLVVYDNVNQKIGWIQSDCTKPHTERSIPFF